ncbi:importin subunit alpha-9-like isoform X1 [Homarus americanus]|uniref:importin subunit alpha-9-like isoform X1 n=1 Tax=Homarus americanus TaxID=6706 RepID=UPI001C446168|nr:importin subunit alpha-9-like isoform X1 [Homarus americanus]XP_042215585.1 importin subunit alpha-9-like isoform X1 [Homarus americanus]
MECKNTDSVESIRQRVRDSDQAFRLKKRSMARDVRRLHLDIVVKKLKIPSKEEVALLSFQLKKNKNLETLQRIRLGLSNSTENVTVFLNCDGALYSLLGCLTSHDASLQREAACTLVNLALGTEKQCLEVCQKAGVYLVMYMSNTNPDLQDPCAWCIGNLCGTHVSVCNLLRSQGVEVCLVNLLQSHSPHVLQSAAYALVHYLTTLPERIRDLCEPSMVRRLISALSQECAVVEIGWCLFVLSANQELCGFLVDQGIIEAAFTVMEQLINEQNMNVFAVTPIVRVVMNCVGAVPGTAVQVCYRSEQFVRVTKALLYSSYPHLRNETIHLIANVVNAATEESLTGQCIVDDLSLRPRLESAVRSALAAKFTTGPPETTNFHGVM